MDESRPIIRIENVSKVFGRRSKQALEMRRAGQSKLEVERATGSTIGTFDANFEVYRHEIFVLIGLSGSGKSTLLRLINRLIEPTEGNVYLDDVDLCGMEGKRLREIRRKKVGMVFQHFGLLPNRTVLSNVAFGLEIQGMPRRERERRGMEALELVGLHGQEGKLITELSGGMKQRVGLGRALATGQEILLMDEPFSALDPLIRRDMQNLFLDIQGEVQRTVVFVTHDLDEALRLGHRAAIMKDGEIVQLGTPEDILSHPATDYVKKFVEDVDYTKVRTAESVMVPPREVAYESEGPHVVLRRMRSSGLTTIPVVDEERRMVGRAEVDDVAALAERNAGSIREAVTRPERSVPPQTFLRDILPYFLDSNVPVMVLDDRGKLLGVVTRGALIGGLATSAQIAEGDGRVPVLAGREREGVRR